MVSEIVEREREREREREKVKWRNEKLVGPRR